MPSLSLSFAGVTDVGLARENNEDAFQITDLSSGNTFDGSAAIGSFQVGERGALLALSDGMGGHAGGEIASSVVISALSRSLRADAHRYGEQKLEAAIRDANAEVVATAQKRNKHGMGATLTAVLVDDTGAYIAEVGDSRAYLLRGGELKQLTRDQSLVQLLVDTGMCTPEQAETSPQKNILLQAMGLRADIHAAIGHVVLRQRDKMLLCSDGVSNALSAEELRDILAANDPDAACQRMVNLANQRGGADNLTAVVALFEDGSLAPASPSESVTATFTVIKDFGPGASAFAERGSASH
jgi:serine/threonine protein phosphatase PrpC